MFSKRVLKTIVALYMSVIFQQLCLLDIKGTAQYSDCSFLSIASFECETRTHDTISLGFPIKKGNHNFCFAFFVGVSGWWQVVMSKSVNTDLLYAV